MRKETSFSLIQNINCNFIKCKSSFCQMIIISFILKKVCIIRVPICIIRIALLELYYYIKAVISKEYIT